MRFSLIVATIGRTEEIILLFESLARQTHRDFEVIVVDQNQDDRLAPIIQLFGSRFEIRHLTSAPGLSRSRNVGLREVSGELVCFPDDDCWYGDDLLEQVKDRMTANPQWDGVIGEAIDADGNPILPWPDRFGRLTRPMSWRRACSIAQFVRRSVFEKIPGFDESLGAGSGTRWGCGEDQDLMLSILEAGYRVYFDPTIKVYHPLMLSSFNDRGLKKRWSYALGEGRTLSKHPMPLWWVSLFFAVPLCRAILAALKFRRLEVIGHWTTARGRASGFLKMGEAAQRNTEGD